MNGLIKVDVAHVSPIHETFRTKQIAGLFDLPPAKNTVEHFHAQLPELDAEWQIGLIVGPSGSGKTSIARKVYPLASKIAEELTWNPDQSVIDDFDQQLSVKQITGTLTAVGFSSPPSWLKPFHVLSGGEQFRATLARALLSPHELLIFDEFTSVVDRTVATIASAALAKGLRKDRFTVKKFVAVSCHYDIVPWLTPDWIFDTATYKLARGQLQRRPPITLTLHPANHALWDRFKRHHYLSANLSRTARCYVARWELQPVCFVATMPNHGHRGVRRISRIVTLPDFQGVGIGSAVLEAVADQELTFCERVSITTSHPAMIAYCRDSPKWRTTRFAPLGMGDKKKSATASQGRPVASFQYIPITVPAQEFAPLS